ncbi:MAG: LysR substrate-binding domain-containing protein [Oligoflexales bacterium]
MPTLSQLNYIVAVDRYRHFGNAAKHCHISQPSLSIQIQKVEEELETVLFDRNKKPVLPTNSGKIFIEQAKKVLREHEKLVNLVHSQAQVIGGPFSIGMIPTVLPYLLPIFVKDFLEAYPSIDFSAEEMKTVDIIEALKSDHIDAGILATPLKEDGIRELPLYCEDFLIYHHKNHAIGFHTETFLVRDLEEIHPTDLWLLKDGHCLRNQVSQLCSSQQRHTVLERFSFEGGSLETLRMLIRSTNGYTLIPRSFAISLPKKELKECAKEFSPPVPVREISIVYARDQWKKSHIKALANTIKNAIPQALMGDSKRESEIIGIE